MREEAAGSASVARGQLASAASVPLSPWYERVAFWRAVAGMALALALAFAIIMFEAVSHISASHASYHRRLQLLRSRLSHARAEVTIARERLAGMSKARVARGEFSRILSAPDGTLVHLNATSPLAVCKGVLVFSKNTGHAALEISGLTPRNDYGVYWLALNGAQLSASRFRVGNDGNALVILLLPGPHTRIIGTLVISETGGQNEDSGGAVVLKATWTTPWR